MKKVDQNAIRRILKKWRPRLGLGDAWEIQVNLHHTRDTWKGEENSPAYIIPDTAYYQAQLHINKPEAEQCAASLEHILLHELNHLVVWNLYVIARDALGDEQKEMARILNEQTVERITRAMLGLM